MKNRKAFTLIELLAVVVILGLLVAIAYPAVNKYIEETKDTTYTLHESDMKTAAKNMMSECIQNDTEDCVPEPGESKTIYLSELIDTKYSNPIKDPGKKDDFCKNDRSYVVVTNTGDSTVKLEYDVCLTCDKYASGKCSELEPGGTCDSTTDTTAPTCGEVVGGSTLWTNKDRVISVHCNDVGCGCTKKIFYKTFTEASQKGTITITDKAGRSTECEVNVYVDKDKPTCELEIVGTIGENEWYGGETPIVRFKTNGKKDQTSGIATYGMGLSSKDYDFNKKESYTAPTGISTIYGYVKDNAGNIGTCYIEVKYDSVPATLDKIDYGSIVYPKADIASVDGNKRVITLDKTILDEYGDIYGLYFYQKSSSTGMTVTAKTGDATVKTATLSSGVTKPIRMLFDSAIRISEYDLTIDLGANNKVDSISRIEVITRNDTVGYYTNQNVTLYLNSHDSLSGKAYYTFDGTNYQEDNYYTFTQNTNGVVVSIKDHAGNITEATNLKITNIDKLKPSCTLKKSRGKDGNGVDWYNKSVDILFESQADAPPTVSYAMSGLRDWVLNIPTGRGTNKTRTQLSETTSTVDVGYILDNAGNINTCSTVVKLDLTDPIAGTITMTAGGSTISDDAKVNKDVVVTVIDGSDTGDVKSGHYTTKYTVVKDGITISDKITGSATYSAEGNYTVTVITHDQSGRYSTREYKFKIDKTPPTCSLSVGTDGVKLASYSDDDGGSGIKSYDLTTSATTTGNKNTSLSLSASKFYGHVTDVAGNTASCSATLVNAIRHYKKTVNKCNRAVESYTCKYTASHTYTQYTKKCTVSYDCMRAAIPHYGECSAQTTSSGCKSYSGCTWSSGKCTGGTGTLWSCGDYESTNPPGGCVRRNQATCGDAWGTWHTNYGTTTSSSSGLSSCSSSGSDFTKSACESNMNKTYKYCSGPQNAKCHLGSGYSLSGTTCTKTQSSSTCVSGATKTTNYKYWWTDTVTADTTSCSSSSSFTCNYDNTDDTYTTCDFLRYECTSDMGSLVNSYCYIIH